METPIYGRGIPPQLRSRAAAIPARRAILRQPKGLRAPAITPPFGSLSAVRFRRGTERDPLQQSRPHGGRRHLGSGRRGRRDRQHAVEAVETIERVSPVRLTGHGCVIGGAVFPDTDCAHIRLRPARRRTIDRVGVGRHSAQRRRDRERFGGAPARRLPRIVAAVGQRRVVPLLFRRWRRAVVVSRRIVAADEPGAARRRRGGGRQPIVDQHRATRARRQHSKAAAQRAAGRRPAPAGACGPGAARGDHRGRTNRRVHRTRSAASRSVRSAAAKRHARSRRSRRRRGIRRRHVADAGARLAAPHRHRPRWHFQRPSQTPPDLSLI